MDMSNYRADFVSEAKDNLDELNNYLLVLEKDQGDMENINHIFRIFHTLKGNSAAMGFSKISEFAHTMEDMMSTIRDKKTDATSEIIDLILEGCDLLETSVKGIASGGDEKLEAEDLIEEFKHILGKREDSVQLDIDSKATLTDAEQRQIEEYKNQGMSVFRIIVIFGKTNVLKSPKSMLIFRDLGSKGKVVRTSPSQNDILAGKFESEIEIVFATRDSKENISRQINYISGLKHVIVLGLEEEYVKPELVQHEEKEHAKAEIINQHREYAVGKIQSVKVSMEKLDKLLNLVGELLISNIRLQDILHKKDFDSMTIVLNEVDRLVLELQSDVMEVRMVPIGSIFKRFPRMVRDLANKEGKKINLVIEGEDIEFDRTVLDKIGDPLVHLLRNCVDHGIETPSERLALNKTEAGTIKLIARREKNKAVIEVTDDGKGINPKEVRETCIKKGMLTKEQALKMDEIQLRSMVFQAGVSTNKVVTDVSGRGVGMDVVKNTVEAMRGKVELASVVGAGTTVTINLPLTIAIVTSLLIEVCNDIYAIPLSSISQTVDIHISMIKTILGRNVFLLRGREIPVFWLHEVLGYNAFKKRDKVTVIIVNKESESIGLIIDSIYSKQQILIKGFSDLLKGTRGFSGATILGDGRVALILDVSSLL